MSIWMVVLTFTGAILYTIAGVWLYRFSKRLGPITEDEQTAMDDMDQMFLPRLYSLRIDDDDEERLLGAILWPMELFIDAVFYIQIFFSRLIYSAVKDPNF